MPKKNIKRCYLKTETVLGYFVFDRNIYGDKINMGTRKWRWRRS